MAGTCKYCGRSCRDGLDEHVLGCDGLQTPSERIAALEAELAQRTAEVGALRVIDVVFDGPPGPEAGRFVEVETAERKSIRVGEWIERDDGYWVLRLKALAATAPTKGD